MKIYISIPSSLMRIHLRMYDEIDIGALSILQFRENVFFVSCKRMPCTIGWNKKQKTLLEWKPQEGVVLDPITCGIFEFSTKFVDKNDIFFREKMHIVKFSAGVWNLKMTTKTSETLTQFFQSICPNSHHFRSPKLGVFTPL